MPWTIAVEERSIFLRGKPQAPPTSLNCRSMPAVHWLGLQCGWYNSVRTVKYLIAGIDLVPFVSEASGVWGDHE